MFKILLDAFGRRICELLFSPDSEDTPTLRARYLWRTVAQAGLRVQIMVWWQQKLEK